MEEVGCDLFLDIHGDEEIPFNFLAGNGTTGDRGLSSPKMRPCFAHWLLFTQPHNPQKRVLKMALVRGHDHAKHGNTTLLLSIGF